jgi:hypothetical protein
MLSSCSGNAATASNLSREVHNHHQQLSIYGKSCKSQDYLLHNAAGDGCGLHVNQNRKQDGEHTIQAAELGLWWWCCSF